MVEGVVSKRVDGLESSAGGPVVSDREFSLDLLKSHVVVDLSLEKLHNLSLE